MYILVTILIIVACILLTAVVLIQNPKGGGLSSSFGGVSQQLLGARRSTDVVEKLTWGFAIALMVLCLSTTFFIDKKAVLKKEQLPKSEIEQMQMSQPFAPTATPPAGQGSVQPSGQPSTPPSQEPTGQAPAN
ncbi:MAG: preprotein translocase subunit SecG [Bacteroidetes bacterium]|nr:preprotein translocase subunit SecG [Bacteroidota bacterium]